MHKSKMNDEFYQQIFPAFSDQIDMTRLGTDQQSISTDEFVFDWLIRTVRPRDIIEIGSWKGHSANYIIDHCRKEGLDPGALPRQHDRGEQRRSRLSPNS